MHSIPFEPKLKPTSSLLIEDPKIEILLDNIDSRKHVPIVHKKNGNVVYVPRYTNRDAAISGKIQTNFKESMAHKYNAKIELIGKIDFFGVKGKSFKFVTIEKDLGMITDTNGSIEFKFENIPNKYESYSGLLAEITYMLRATVINYDLEETKHEQEIVLHLPTRSPQNANTFIIQIGVMEAVEVDLEYKKTDYHLEECIVGRVLVNVAKVEIRKIEVYLMKIENYFFGSKSKLKEEVLKKIIIKEGQPKKGEMIPLKLSLGPLDLSPTMQTVEDRYSIRYFLTLGLIDSNERMFFRKVEITLRRAMEFEK